MEKGFQNEINIAKAYDGKKFSQLNTFQKKFVKQIFDDVNDDSIFTTRQCDPYSKPDISIRLNNQVKYISIKCGHCNYVHSESIKSFILYLRKLGISKQTQKTILLFHYGDDTLDGSGERRFSGIECRHRYQKLIDLANKELNVYRIKKAFIYYVLLQGINDAWNLVDYIYFGDENYAEYTSRDNILNYILNRSYDHLKFLHCGPFVMQPYLRDLEHKSKHKFKRKIIQVRWLQMKKDIIIINKNKYKQKVPNFY